MPQKNFAKKASWSKGQSEKLPVGESTRKNLTLGRTTFLQF